MSIQEERFAQIAAAIREKDGSTEPIKALNFAARILAIPTGGGGSTGFAVPLVVTVDTNAEVTATNGDITVTGTTDADNIARLTLTAPGVWTVTARQGDKEKSTEVEVIDGYDSKLVLLSRLPAGYTELEYIESTGTQVIDSGVSPSSILKVEMDISPANRPGTLFGSWVKVSSTSWARFSLALLSTASLNALRVNYGLNKYIDVASFEQTPLERIFAYIISNGNSANYGYGNFDGTISGQGTFSNIPTCSLLAYHSTIGFSDYLRAKLYSCQMYFDTTLIRDFVPCINPTGTVGLFDLVEEKFYGNAGTGTFTAGPAV